MDNGEKLDDIASGNIFFMYANSYEGRGLLRYLDQQKAAGKPMALAGIDSQHSGKLSQSDLLPGLATFLQNRHSKLAQGPDWQNYTALSQALFGMQREAPAEDKRAAFYRLSKSLQKELCAATGDNTRFGPVWWCQVVKSVQSQATSYWSGGRDYQRDNQMGANAIWLADHLLGGKKTVIWAHTVHVGRGFQRGPTQLQAGEVMHRQWGPAYKVVQFSAAQGALLDFITMQPLDVAAIKPGSLEARLGKAGYTLAGMTATAPVELPQFTFEYATHPVETGMQGKLGVNWDVLFFINTIHPVRMTR
ncbi:MAG: erythromycin esterase family protein [Pseudomonadota bacterium]